MQAYCYQADQISTDEHLYAPKGQPVQIQILVPPKNKSTTLTVYQNGSSQKHSKSMCDTLCCMKRSCLG